MEFINVKYSGDENNGRMEGENCRFSYITEGMRYEGEMKDGQFHGRGTIYFSSGAKVEGLWHLGKLVERTYIYKDGLTLNENVKEWDYCRLNPNGDSENQDRRFYIEVLQQDGFEGQNVMPRVEHACFSKDGINPSMN